MSAAAATAAAAAAAVKTPAKCSGGAATLKDAAAHIESQKLLGELWVNPATSQPVTPLPTNNPLTDAYWRTVTNKTLFTVKPAFAEVLRQMPRQDPDQVVFSYEELVEGVSGYVLMNSLRFFAPADHRFCVCSSTDPLGQAFGVPVFHRNQLIRLMRSQLVPYISSTNNAAVKNVVSSPELAAMEKSFLDQVDKRLMNRKVEIDYFSGTLARLNIIKDEMEKLFHLVCEGRSKKNDRKISALLRRGTLGVAVGSDQEVGQEQEFQALKRKFLVMKEETNQAFVDLLKAEALLRDLALGQPLEEVTDDEYTDEEEESTDNEEESTDDEEEENKETLKKTGEEAMEDIATEIVKVVNQAGQKEEEYKKEEEEKKKKADDEEALKECEKKSLEEAERVFEMEEKKKVKE